MKKLKMNLQMFSSTNKTSHYELSQYVSSDKPTYLTDYNGDMSKIDTGIYDAKNKADTNATNIGDLTTLTTEAKSTLIGAINEVDSHADTNAENITKNTTNTATNTSHIGTLTNLETTAKTDLVSAINELKSIIENFNLSTFNTLDSTHMSSSTGSINQISSLTVAKNSDGSLAKIYGQIILTGATANSATITITGSGLTPASDITINNAGICRHFQTAMSGYDVQLNGIFDLTIKTNGNIEITRSTLAGGATPSQYITFWPQPYLYFVKDFGDVPIN